MAGISARLAAVIDALPLRPGMRVLEVGGAPGTAARAIAARLGGGHILVIDRSPTGVAQIERTAHAEIAAGVLSTRCVSAETFALLPGEAPFDLAFAVRVGAFDGRHPKDWQLALPRIESALTRTGRLFIDGGDPLREIVLR